MRLKLRFPRLPFTLPTLTTAEKTALATLILLLAGGGALRVWEHAGVRIGPVDDWESLRKLVIGAREKGERYACEDDAARGHYASAVPGPLAAGGEEPVVLSAGMSFGKPRGKGAAGSSKKTGPARPVDLNTAGEKALLSLPGVGPSTAKAILAHRAARGPFSTVEDLMQVKGIGPGKMEIIRPFVRVAPREEPSERPREERAETAPKSESPVIPSSGPP
jgi:competence ComEA-like helix-hairpin-helix protein